MAKTKLKPVSVYMTESQLNVVRQVAGMENRSVSNALLSLALSKAAEMGIKPIGKRDGPKARKV